MKNSLKFSTTILRDVIIGGRYYRPGDTALVNAETFRELVAIFAADPKDRTRRRAGTKPTRRSH